METSERERREQEVEPLINQKAYRLNISLSYFMWAFVLLGFVVFIEFPTFLSREDFSSLAQIATNISAICLALLALIHGRNPNNTYLKLAIAGLCLNFLLVTLLSILVLVTTNTSIDRPFEQTLKLIVFVGLFASLGTIGLVSLTIERFLLNRNIHFHRLRLAAVLVNQLKVRLPNNLLDYSIFILPFVVIIVWSDPLNLASATLTLVGGGLTSMIVLSVVFTVQIARRPQPESNHLQTIILTILGDIHVSRRSNPIIPSYELIDEDTIATKIADKGLFVNISTVRDAIREMQRKDLIYSNYSGCYKFPTEEDINASIILMREVELALTGLADSANPLVHENIECSLLVRFLSEKTSYPIECIKLYFLQRALDELRLSSDSPSSLEVADRHDSFQIVLYPKVKKLRVHWQELKSCPPVINKPDLDHTIQVFQNIVNLHFPDIEIQEEDLKLLPSLLDRLMLIPEDHHLVLKEDDRCIALLIFGLTQVLSEGAEINETTGYIR